MKPKFKKGEFIQWYNNVICGIEILSQPYEIINMLYTHNEWLYSISGKDATGKLEITQIYESGVYKYKRREEKLERILKNK